MPGITHAAATGNGYQIGDKVSDFSLKNVDGKMVSLADYATSKGVIVIFDCNTCPYSRAYNKRIQDLNNTFAPKGFPVITINANDATMSPGDSFDEMVKKAKHENYNFPYLVDQTQEVAHSFGATNTPHVFVLQNVNGAFYVRYIGAIDNNARDADEASKRYVADAVNELLAGKPVAVERTRAIGCSIRYRGA